MKRSEAIQKLIYILKINERSLTYTDAGLASDLLKAMENMGMQPPPIPQVGKCGQYVGDMRLGWEPEEDV